MALRNTALAGVLLLAAGCAASVPGGATSADVIELQEEVKVLKEELGRLKERTDRVELNDTLADINGIAYLQPGDGGYSTIKYDLGTLTVQLTDVQPYANGSKVALKFGNPLFSEVNGLKATVEWGQTDEKGNANNETAKSKDVVFSESLRPGAWSSASLVLEGLPPSQLGFVRLRNVTHTGIKLNR